MMPVPCHELAPNATLVRILVPADGACLFRAIGFAVFGRQDKHEDLRRECVEHMRSHADSYAPFAAGEIFVSPLLDSLMC